MELLHRIVRFMEDPEGSGDRFESLALAVWAHQVEHSSALRRLAERRRALPGALADPREIPPVPTTAFQSVDLAPAPSPEEAGGVGERLVFRSSGTTGGGVGPRSVHVQPYPELYRRTVDLAFPAFCLPPERADDGAPRLPMLALVPPRTELPDSSLSFMVDHILGRWGTETSRHAFGAGGLDGPGADAWAAAREAAGEPVAVLATAFALAEWLDRLEADGRRHRLPAGSVLFETGGFKGRTRELPRPELLRRTGERLGIPPERVVREYGMAELTSQLYTRVLAGGAPDLFVPPHWLRVRVLDPLTLADAAFGETGLVAFLDLANLGSTVSLVTQDLGRLETTPEGDPGLRLLGRAQGAALRGCSLAAEEMSTTTT